MNFPHQGFQKLSDRQTYTHDWNYIPHCSLAGGKNVLIYWNVFYLLCSVHASTNYTPQCTAAEYLYMSYATRLHVYRTTIFWTKQCCA